MDDPAYPDALSSATAMGEWLSGRRPHPPRGYRLWYHETRWSYRQPISYEVTDSAGRRLASIVPADRATRRDSVVVRDGVPVLRMRVDRRGSTAVSDAAGGDLGRLRRRNGLATFRLALSRDGRHIGAVEQRWHRIDRAEVRTRRGTAARIGRSGRRRFAGADRSYLELGRAADAVPAALLFAAVPALDAMRKQWRSERRG